MSSAIESYIATLRTNLAFDPQLAARLCDEVEEHLHDIAEQEADVSHAEERAVRRMGDPRRLAAEMARAALPGRMRMTWQSLGLCIVAVLLAMRLRNEMLPVDQVPISVLVDRLAFGIALLLGCTAAFLAWTEVRIRYVVNLTIASMSLLAVSAAVGVTMLLHLNSLGEPLAPMRLPLFAIVMEWGVLLVAFVTLRGLIRHARKVE